ncbi:MAG: hypothetical protein B7Z66_03660 [Chromatiales bacterium 21-64-14]|nr:MAG: hypothetical protein B7Z66_03660 [Chromatiales bacterium 21-64-14]HQU14825.1 hypothetical protein [Gammaproteobacteria bacterium]
MAQLPEKTEQILQAHAGLIHRVVIAAQNRDMVPDLEPLLELSEQNGWTRLVAVIRRILKGQRDTTLLRDLDGEDRIITEAILRGLQDPTTLPDPETAPDPSLAAPGFAAMIHAVRHGNMEALQLLANMAQQMQKMGGDMARLAAVLNPLARGEQDPERLTQGMSPKGEQLVLAILEELRRLQTTAH